MPISLFYLYHDVSDPDGLAARLQELGPAHGLAGRMRVSPEGLNATVGGPSAGIETLHAFVSAEFPGAAVDFKVSQAGGAAELAHAWRVRRVAEVVTLGPHGKGVTWRDASPHIDAHAFRDEVLAASAGNGWCPVGDGDGDGGGGGDGDGDTVVLDVRNRYESEIGRFDGAVRAPIRQFSDLPSYLRDHRAAFAGRRVLMYCTGGVRCEKASAVVRRECGAASVAQLDGGIERFLEAFPDGGGVFHGRNLVFDGRMAVGRCGDAAVGRCVVCAAPWDDYASGWRCSRCRARVLICDGDGCAEAWEVRLDAVCKVCLGDEAGRIRGKNK